MKKRNKALASATVLSLVLTSVGGMNVQAAAEVTRVQGANREATAMEVAKQAFGTAETVVLVNGYGYADAVSATPLAKALNAPILLTNKVDAPTADLKATLASLGAKNVVIVGGTGAVTPAMESALKANYTVARIGGSSRYETNALVAKAVLAKTGAKEAVLVSAEGYADALSVASVAAAKGMPVLFGNKNEVPAAVKSVATGLQVVAVGGAGVLPASVLSSVNATRVAEGATRFETNLAVLEHFKADLKLDNIYVAAGGATATGFADALVASAAAAKVGAPVVLTGAGANAAAQENATEYIADSKTEKTKVTVIGGTGSVSQAIYNDLEDVVSGSVTTELTVNSAKAVSTSNIELSGVNLAGLKATDVTVADHTVKSVSVNADGKTATVVLEDALAPDVEATVKVASKEFKVTFKVEADTVAVKEATYDNDTAKQYVAITVNGNATTVADLEAAGYDVEFSAVSAKTNGDDLTDDLFEDVSTGKLNDNLNEYLDDSTSKSPYIQVTLTKGSDVITSTLQKITIKNLDVVASSITDVIIKNTQQKYDNEAIDNNNAFEQNSTKLVTGEQAEISKIKISVDGNKETVYPGSYTVKSSNKAVVNVTEDYKLEAIGPGTATLTVTYGSVTKTVSITVSKDERELTKVVVQKQNTNTAITSLKVAENKEVKVDLVALDQYGDPMPSDIYVKSSNKDIFADGTKLGLYSVEADADGTLTTIGTTEDTGSTTLSFYNSEDYTYRIGSSSLTLTVLENGDVSKSVLEIYNPTNDADADGIVAGTDSDNFSDDLTIDLSDDNYVAFQLNQFTSDGVLLGAADDVDESKITLAQSRADVIDSAEVIGDKVVVKGNKTGTATVKVIDPVTGLAYTKKITVVDDGNEISSVSFKSIADPTYSVTLKYSTALTKTDSGDLDPKISGITMKKAVSQSIRLDLDNGMLYIDKNADGTYTDGTDTEIGTFTITAVGDFKNDVESLADGIKVVSGDDGTVIFKVLDTDGDVVASKSVEVDF